MATNDRGIKASEPLAKPDVPEYAERLNILNHVRHQFHPLLLNAIGGPDINGPKQYLGIEIMCPICQRIQSLGPPGQEQACEKCDLRWKYTAAKGNQWLWIWRAQPKLNLDAPENQVPSPPKNLIVIPTGRKSESGKASPSSGPLIQPGPGKKT